MCFLAPATVLPLNYTRGWRRFTLVAVDLSNRTLKVMCVKKAPAQAIQM
jgi:hypothetical protein